MVSSAPLASLKIMIFQANLEKDTNIFLTMNPYYTVNYANQKIKGHVCYDGGKNPNWADFDSVNHVLKLNSE